jgi:hypothetical protein
LLVAAGLVAEDLKVLRARASELERGINARGENASFVERPARAAWVAPQLGCLGPLFGPGKGRVEEVEDAPLCGCEAVEDDGPGLVAIAYPRVAGPHIARPV